MKGSGGCRRAPATHGSAMDASVIAAMARWPDVPDVFGWLSLSEQGLWRIHPDAGALSGVGGEPVSNARLMSFINRNYANDGHGRWYFQNGPQRVFVRLDAAPYILRTHDSGAALRTHTGLDIDRIDAWWLDDGGRLYARTEHGPGLVAGRDLGAVLDSLRTIAGLPLMEALARAEALDTVAISLRPIGRGTGPTLSRGEENGTTAPPTRLDDAAGVPLKFCPASKIAAVLEFDPNPGAN